MTARRRRSSLEGLLAETAPEPTTRQAPVVEDRPPPPPPPAPTRRKFTMLVEPADDDRARRVVDDVVARAGIRTTKQMRADVVRALFAEADQDPALRERLAARLRDSMPS